MVVSTLPLFILVSHTTKVQKKVLGNQKDRRTFCGGGGGKKGGWGVPELFNAA